MKIVFYSTIGLLIISGIFFYRTVDWSGYLFSFVSTAAFVVSIAALISFISLYFYELPTHHCPFCIMQKEYWYVGYVLYILLLTGTIAGMGVGVLMPFRGNKSLEKVIPSILHTLTIVSMICFAFFTLIATYQMIFSSFRLEGY